MAAIPEDIRLFFALIGKNVTNQHLLKAQEALATQRYGFEVDGITPRTPTTSDFVDWLYRQARAFVNRATENNVRAAVVIPLEDLFND